MKKLFFLAVAVIVAASTNAQVLQKNDNVINVGIGVPAYTGSLRIPAVAASWEMGFTEKIGIGYIGGGLLGGLSGTRTASYNYTHITFGPRAAYHFDFAEITGSDAFDKLDIYAGIMVGFRIEIGSSRVNNLSNNTNFRFNPDGFIGARYSFADNIGVFGEVGGNVSYISGGICFKL